MWMNRSRSRTGASGVAKIVRHTYNTKNGMAVKSGWWEIRKAVFDRDRGMCVKHARMGQQVPGTEVHHIVALSKGGTTTMSNLITLCEGCHDKRHRHLFRARSQGRS